MNARRLLHLLLLITALGTAGCRPTELETVYGKRRGTPGAASVNGTGVLAAMFESAGHRVLTWRRLSPKLYEFDTLVWFPDDFELPTEEHRQFLEEWLADDPGRTLVYVGRDYDAAVTYWQQVRPLAPPPQVAEVTRRSALAQAMHDRRRAELAPSADADWFRLRSTLPRRTVTTLRGPWSGGIDPKQTQIVLDSRFEVPDQEQVVGWLARMQYDPDDRLHTERLLYAPEDPIVTRLSLDSWQGSQILVVTNGSFLLNLPLVNAEHRKLAGRLINACGPAGRVAFLESNEEGLPILEHDPGADSPTGFEVFTVWPIGVILLHLTALGILACIALFPVFGRPRELPPVDSADFGQHVAALGELLELTGDREYALNRVRQYHELVETKTPRPPSR